MASKVVDEMMDEEVKLELTPMIDISFLIIIFFMCLPFKTLEGKLQAFLPTDKGINPIPADPPNEIKVSVHILARGERERQWGPEGRQITVNMPDKAQYKYADRDPTNDLSVVADWIKNAKKTAEGGESKVIGEIKAGHKVQQKFVVAVLNKFAQEGITKVDFFGTALPNKKQRTAKLLPYPAKNYGTSD